MVKHYVPFGSRNMKDIIFEFVRSFGVLIILRKKLISGALDYYFIDWMGTDSQFYSLLVICNESQIFSKDVIAIGSSDESLSPLTSNLKQFSTKEDWVIDKWDLNYAKKLEAFLADQLSQIDLTGCDTETYHVLNCIACLRPMLQYVITYRHDDTILNLVLQPLNITQIIPNSAEHAEFILNIVTRLHLNNYINLSEETRWQIYPVQ